MPALPPPRSRPGCGGRRAPPRGSVPPAGCGMPDAWCGGRSAASNECEQVLILRRTDSPCREACVGVAGGGSPRREETTAHALGDHSSPAGIASDNVQSVKRAPARFHSIGAWLDRCPRVLTTASRAPEGPAQALGGTRVSRGARALPQGKQDFPRVSPTPPAPTPTPPAAPRVPLPPRGCRCRPSGAAAAPRADAPHAAPPGSRYAPRVRFPLHPAHPLGCDSHPRE